MFFNKIISFACFLVLIFSGCGSFGQKQAESPEPVQITERQVEDEKRDSAEMRPQVIDRDVLTVAFSQHEIELDFRNSYMADEAQLYTALYEGLYSYHPLTLAPVPAAAEKWELSEDKKQWTFTIRQRASFSNGDPLTAEDFRAAWISLLDPKRDSPYSGLFDIIEGARDYRNGILRDSEKVGIKANGPKTLVVTLNSPASFFPAMLCHHSFSPIHSSMLRKTSWLPGSNSKNWEPPVSNGAFKILSMDDDSIVMVKNEKYWDSNRVELNNIIIKFTETGDEASYLWNSGEARWISGDVNIEMLTDRSGIQVNPMFATHYYFIRSAVKPWNDYRVRRAMALVLPWDEIRGAQSLPAKSLIFPISGYPDVEGITEPDYDEAKKLIAEAGYADGKGTPELVIRITPSREAARVAELMAVAWKEVLALNVRVEVIPYNRYFHSMKEDGYVVGSSTWIGDFADPYTFLQMWRRDSNLNDARYDDMDYEDLIDKSMLEDGDKRFAILAEAEEMLLNRGVVLPINYTPALNIIDTGELEGWYPNVMDIHPFKYMFFKAYRPLPGVAQSR